MQLLTKEFLTRHDACQSGVDFAINNNLIGLPVEFLKSSEGDFKGFKSWLQGLPECTYNKDRNLLTQTNPTGSLFRYTYDQYGNMLTRTYPDGSVYKYRYTYDQHGNVLTKTRPNGDVHKYTYDNKGNMLTQTNPTGSLFRYTYDQHGNMLTRTYPDGGITVWSYKYHTNGQLHKVFVDNHFILEIPLYNGD